MGRVGGGSWLSAAGSLRSSPGWLAAAAPCGRDPPVASGRVLRHGPLPTNLARACSPSSAPPALPAHPQPRWRLPPRRASRTPPTSSWTSCCACPATFPRAARTCCRRVRGSARGLRGKRWGRARALRAGARVEGPIRTPTRSCTPCLPGAHLLASHRRPLPLPARRPGPAVLPGVPRGGGRHRRLRGRQVWHEGEGAVHAQLRWAWVWGMRIETAPPPRVASGPQPAGCTCPARPPHLPHPRHPHPHPLLQTTWQRPPAASPPPASTSALPAGAPLAALLPPPASRRRLRVLCAAAASPAHARLARPAHPSPPPAAPAPRPIRPSLSLSDPL